MQGTMLRELSHGYTGVVLMEKRSIELESTKYVLREQLGVTHGRAQGFGLIAARTL
jgi:hypothetical protein